MSKRRIHLGLMCQNNLWELIPNLQRVLPYVDSATIIDGGSQDDTIIYMRNWSLEESKIRFYVYPWKDDFPAQRNNYVKHINEIAEDGDWCLTFDPDEFFEELTLQKLHAAADRAEKDGNNMVGFQCRSVSLKGSKRVWENLDEYWKELFFKWDPAFHYTGYKCHEGKGGVPHNIMRTSLIYEHLKQQNVTWIRGMRNAFHGGGGPNLGSRNPIWIKLKELTGTKLNITKWHDLYSYMLKGNIDQELKQLFIDHMYEGTPKAGPGAWKKEAWDGACFTSDHYILSAKGPAFLLDNVESNTKLLAADGGKTTAIVPMKKQYNGEVVTIKAVNAIPATLTPNHQILVAERISCTKDYNWCRPDCGRSKVKYKVDKRNPAWSGYYKQCAQEYSHEMKWVAAGELEEGKHCVVFPKTLPGKENTRSVAEAELWGWYLADGNRNGNGIEINLNLKTDPISRVEGLIKEAFIDIRNMGVRERPDKTLAVVYANLNRGEAINFCNLFGSGARNKVIPLEVFNWNQELLQAFVRGAFLGDGSCSSKGKNGYVCASYTTSSMQLAHEMQFILSKLGIFAGFSAQQREDRFSKEPIYRLTVEGRQASQMKFVNERLCGSDKQYFFQDEKYFYLPIVSISCSQYEGPVYNVETEENTYVSGFVVHNSEMREMYRTYFRILHPEEQPEEFKNISNLDDWS